jgi:GT2 family glycosyltransferase
VSSPVPQRQPARDIPYGAEIISAAATDPSGWLILGRPNDGLVPTKRISDLLGGPFGIGGVIPGPEPAGGVEGDLFCRDVSVTSSEYLAVRASIVAGAKVNPLDEDPESVITDVLARLRDLGLRLVCDPRWTNGTSGARLASPDEDCSRILIVTAALESGASRPDRQSVWDLVNSLAAHARHSQIVVVTAERCRCPGDAADLRAQGIQVHEGPTDWKSWFYGQMASFSHIIFTASGLQSSARQWIDVTQPQAMKVLFWPWLASREMAVLGPITAGDELAGLDQVRRSVEERIREIAPWADALWCETRQDADFLASSLPGKAIFHLPTALRADRSRREVGDRSGVAVVAVEGHDVIAGSEDAAVRVLHKILPQIHWRDRDVKCTVVSEYPSPMLEEAAALSGAEIVRSARFEEVVRSSRLLIAAHGYGSGQSGVIKTALEAGTPFIATPFALGALDIGPLRRLAIHGSDPDIATRSWGLLSDDSHWAKFSRAAARFVAGEYSDEKRTFALRSALAFCGVEVGKAEQRWPPLDDHTVRRPRVRPVRVDLRPHGAPEPSPLSGPEPTRERERYRLWVERHGPNPEALLAIRQDLERMRHRPTFSIVVPVFNTEPRILLETIDSIRAQVYADWQLCIANDGSDRAETLEVLASLSGDPAIVVVNLPSSKGISGATNAAIEVADGDYVTFVDHDDLLKPHALAQVARWIDADPTLDVIYSDEDKVGVEGYLYDPHFKPDWSPDQLMNHNYVSHLTVARRSLLAAVGGLRSDYDGSQDHDLMLRLAEVTDRVAHIPEPLYTWRAVPGSAADVVDAKPYALDASRRAISDALIRRGYSGRVDTTRIPGCFRARYDLRGKPRVTIIIPTKDGAELLKRCIDSVLELSSYKNFEILIIDNQSTDRRTLGYLAQTPARVIRYPYRFNYARMMNYAARLVECDALLFLNNDTKVITPDWIQALLELAMRPEVGAVGGRLYFPDGSPQHEGIMVGIWGGWAGNVNFGGYWNRGDLIRNASAVTGACTMIRPSVYWRVGGNDERLRIAYNDVDLCLRIRQAGYEVVYTPFAELLHYESASRSGYEHPMDGPLFGTRWHPRDTVDPYYSPMLSDHQPFAIRV